MGNSSGKPVVFTDEVNLDHFRLLRVVGKGAFGKVRIVERKDTGLTFALKYIRKDEVVRSESVRNMLRERRMLEHLNHPFLCNLRYSFQDVEYLYIVVDLMTGGDLRFHITRKTFTEEAIRFWIAELGCALRYIHQQNVVHRDVKPDNVLLDSEGHVHLADFNVATDLTPGKPLTSKSGTLAYLAPEVYRGKGYGPEVDWWSLGVLFYECIYSKRPFEGNHHEQLAQSIMKGEPNYPVTNPAVSMVCLHAISSLLEKDRAMRIGGSSWESFIDNPFFRELDFEALERKEIDPIFMPSSEKTNFDATYDLEELLLEEAPLEARTRKQKPRAELRPDATDQEIRADELHRMIETMFEPFNYMTLSDHRYDDLNPITADAILTEVSGDAVDSKRGDSSTDNRSQTDPVKAHPHPHSRSQTPRARSPTQSPNGSPPIPSSIQSPGNHPQEYFTNADGKQAPMLPGKSRTVRYEENANPPQRDNSTSRKPRGSTRVTSMSGSGVQVTLNETGSWSDMANQSQSMIAEDHRGGKSGMLGFLRSKKGRDKSPKARERGVIGKEGARVVVGG
ncbi:Serine/threonine-protein kinase 32A [Sphaceloma murrayae]|uniref:Serine/threonine-protein kinase 32A n=1 Tax=Sphaceloma murrayae TaxID=2082308 RepID=A0A2K1QIZ1_9PEZI|nr:Serine/threonine-protein kinase 32A [Sphaceloma murrayae]